MAGYAEAFQGMSNMSEYESKCANPNSSTCADFIKVKKAEFETEMITRKNNAMANVLSVVFSCV